MAKNKKSRKRPSRLDKLPGEIRNMIYRYAVVEERPIRAVQSTYGNKQCYCDGTLETGIHTNHTKLNRRCHHREPALAMVCRLFRKEVLPIFLAENTFEFMFSFRDKLQPIDNDLRTANFFKATEMEAWLGSLGEYASNVTKVMLHVAPFFLEQHAMQVNITKQGCQVIYDQRLMEMGVWQCSVKEWGPEWDTKKSRKEAVEAAMFLLLEHVHHHWTKEPRRVSCTKCRVAYRQKQYYEGKKKFTWLYR